MEIRQLRPEDVPRAMELSEQAGWNQVAADWHRLLALSPDGCHAGVRDGKLIATSTLLTYGTSDSEGTGWIGLVLVDERHREAGHGTAIFDHVLETAVERGVSVIGLDATDMGRSIYERRGFVDVAPVTRWSGSLETGHEDTRSAIVSDPSLQDILSLDRAVCGVDRGRLVEQLISETGTRTVAITSQATDEYRGYAIVRPGRNHQQIGPVIAKDEDTTKRLLRAVDREVEPASVIMDVLDDSVAETLRAGGLTASRELTRMVHRTPTRALMGPAIVAAAGLELG